VKLIHFSDKIVKSFKSVKQYNDLDSIGKPKGFWVSDEEDYGWKQWCEAEEFRLEKLKYAHEIELEDNHNLLFITSLEQFDIFNKRYTIKLHSIIDGIDWVKVSSIYDGIIITPYLWERRLDFSSRFYYGWDCASGCIWHSKAVKSIRILEDNVELSPSRLANID